MEPLVDEVIELPVADAELIRAALNSAYHLATVLDLQEQYRKLTQRPAPSSITKALQNALTLMMAYMEEAQAKEQSDEPE